MATRERDRRALHRLNANNHCSLGNSLRHRNEDFLRLAKQHLKLTPGAGELLGWLKDEKRIQPYFISSAHPAAILPIAYQSGILSSHVFCSGNQLAHEKTATYDRQRIEKVGNGEETMQKEIAERFPYEKYLNSQNLQDFLSRYLELCVEMNKSYASGRTDEEVVRSSREKQLRLLEEIRGKDKALADDLRHLLYSEDGIMGAHRKKRVLMSIEKLERTKKENLIYTGDSIVDADPIAYAGNGISINCTNRQALTSSKINIATPTMKSLVPIIEHIISNGQSLAEPTVSLQWKIDVETAAGTEAAPPVRVFMTGEIDRNIDAVIRTNRICKDYVKKLYSQ